MRAAPRRTISVAYNRARTGFVQPKPQGPSEPLGRVPNDETVRKGSHEQAPARRCGGGVIERLSRRLGKLRAPWRSLSPNLRGIIWITSGSVAFALNDVLIKTLGRKIDAPELALFRYVTGMAVLAPLFWRAGLAELRTRRLGMHATRLVIASLAQIGTLVAVINLPLASATALSFSRILFTTVVAIVLLRELG